MLAIRKAGDRGTARFGWLDSRHTFSFGHYHDPQFMGHGPLRVINEDRVQPGRGFDTHAHRDMEIISYVLDGGLEHRDSMGNGSTIRPGDVQRMSAGTGVMHSEFNASDDGPRALPADLGGPGAERALRRATSRNTSTLPGSGAGCGSSGRATAATGR